MIYTLTLNPAIDLFINTPTMRPNTVNRTTDYDVQANGKGVNVSFILQRLGVKNHALGVGGGFTLNHITSSLEAAGIPVDFWDTGGITRINVFTHVVDQNQEYKLVNPGPSVSEADQQKVLDYLKGLSYGDTLVVSGSFAAGIRPSFIVEIAKITHDSGCELVIDSSYPAVIDALEYEPLLVKPNDDELADWLGKERTHDTKELIAMAEEIRNRGARNVLVSRGPDGALLVGEDGIYNANAPTIDVLNTAAAGDTMLGTFIAGLKQGKSIEENLTYAVAAGSDTARNQWITDFTTLDDLLPQITVTKED